MIGQYRDAGGQLLIDSDYRNSAESNQLLAADVVRHFARAVLMSTNQMMGQLPPPRVT